MSKTICEHGYSGCHVCQNARLDAMSVREQRRYEIARDVMAALCASNPGANTEIAANDAVYSADVLLAALEETER